MLTHKKTKEPDFQSQGIVMENNETLLCLRAYDDQKDEDQKTDQRSFVTLKLDLDQAQEMRDNVFAMQHNQTGHLFGNAKQGSYHVYQDRFSFSEGLVNIAVRTSTCSFFKLANELTEGVEKLQRFIKANKPETLMNSTCSLEIGALSLEQELCFDVCAKDLVTEESLAMTLPASQIDEIIEAILYGHKTIESKGALLTVGSEWVLEKDEQRVAIKVSPTLALEKARNVRARLESL